MEKIIYLAQFSNILMRKSTVFIDSLSLAREFAHRRGMMRYQKGKITKQENLLIKRAYEDTKKQLGKVICPSCGGSNPIEYKFCRKCGISIRSQVAFSRSIIIRSCPICGNQNSRSYNFCGKCGSPLGRDETRIY